MRPKYNIDYIPAMRSSYVPPGRIDIDCVSEIKRTIPVGADDHVLVIHPEDPTTDFLKEIYKDRNWVVWNPKYSKHNLIELMWAADKIIMLGHGTPSGLIGNGRGGYIIDRYHVPAMHSAKTICIWCNADQFVERYNLKPDLYTGMIISEVAEANYCNVDATAKEVENSNYLFALAVRAGLVSETPAETIMRYYISDESNPVIDFNRQRIFSKIK